MLTRDEILNADDLKKEAVKVPEWGGELVVREMTGGQRDAYETSIMNASAEERSRVIRARMAASCVIDSDGEPMFTVDDIDALSKKSAKALDRVFKVAAKLNALYESDVEEAEGN